MAVISKTEELLHASLFCDEIEINRQVSPISMTFHQSSTKNPTDVIKTHNGEHWKRYIKGTLQTGRGKKECN